jgi:hypothetical protein
MEVHMDKSDRQLVPALAGWALAAMLVISFALDAGATSVAAGARP